MNKRLLLSIGLAITMFGSSFAQEKVNVYAAGFYNLENLWDTQDDPTNPGDDDYLPEGKYRWTNDKYQKKLKNIARVLSELGRKTCPEGPAIIGISEVENRKVLEDVLKTGPMASTNYQIVHFESPDHRGIDVAALYNPELFKFQSAKVYPFNKPDQPDYKTRDVLLVSGELAGESFHMIVNHWPSRYGGAEAEPLRDFAANIVKHIADSIHSANSDAKVLIVGDMNDDPCNRSCAKVLGAKKKMKSVKKGGLYNATWKLFSQGNGTLCYRGNWNLFDQQIISENLLGSDKSTLKFWKAEVFRPAYLVQQEGKYKGYPYRTFAGKRFLGGYSDHFPTITYYVKEK